MPKSNNDVEMRFNDKSDRLGLIAIDNTIKPSIRFCKGEEINTNRIGISSRSITRISINCNINVLIRRANERLMTFREETHDLFLTPFRGIRKDNKYRRRLDYSLARNIINEVL